MAATAQSFTGIVKRKVIQLQEEIENRTVNLVVSTTRLTARTLMHALQKYLNSVERQKIAKKSEKRQIK